jgi:thiosulfate/3-mercaptopyruvate sulfurtransferase
MKGAKVFFLLIMVLLLPVVAMAAQGPSRTIDPIVTTDWLEANLGTTGLVVVDIRPTVDYTAGHITGAVNVPFGPGTWWVISPEGLILQLPDQTALFNLIGSIGITSSSKIVVVNKTDTNFDRADATRVAWTLIYAGLRDVAVLDGGYNKWVADGNATSTEPVTPTTVVYAGTLNENIVIAKERVSKMLRSAKIVDARDPDAYFGVTFDDVYSSRPGHIQKAVSLPTPWVWEETFDGDTFLYATFKNTDTLEAIAEGVIGKNKKNKKIILYCGVGGYASTWWFLLSEVLGYKKVTVYDGSIQEWTMDPDAPVTLYRWN